MVFRAPGPENVQGHKVEYLVVADAEKAKWLEDGWFPSAAAAVEAHQAASAKTNTSTSNDGAKPPTRDEAIQWLDEQKIVFDRRLGLDKLLALIEQKRKELGA